MKEESPKCTAAVIFGSNIRRLRKEKKLTQEKLAEVLGISTKHMGEIESGKSFISGELMDSIVEYFGVRFNELFSDDDIDEVLRIKAYKIASDMLRKTSEDFDKQYGIELHLK